MSQQPNGFDPEAVQLTLEELQLVQRIVELPLRGKALQRGAVIDTVKAMRWLGFRTARVPWIIWLPRARNKIGRADVIPQFEEEPQRVFDSDGQVRITISDVFRGACARRGAEHCVRRAGHIRRIDRFPYREAGPCGKSAAGPRHGPVDVQSALPFVLGTGGRRGSPRAEVAGRQGIARPARSRSFRQLWEKLAWPANMRFVIGRLRTSHGWARRCIVVAIGR